MQTLSSSSGSPQATQNADVILSGSEVILTTLRDTARLAQFPLLQGVACLAIGIVDIINNVRSNRDAFQRLAFDACELVYAIICNRSISRTPPSMGFSENISELERTLKEIEQFATRRKSRGMLVRIIKNKSDIDTIKVYRERLKQSLDVFGLKSSISIHENIAFITKMMEEMRESERKRLEEAKEKERLEEARLRREQAQKEQLEKERLDWEIERRRKEVEKELEEARLSRERAQKERLEKEKLDWEIERRRREMEKELEGIYKIRRKQGIEPDQVENPYPERVSEGRFSSEDRERMDAPGSEAQYSRSNPPSSFGANPLRAQHSPDPYSLAFSLGFNSFPNSSTHRNASLMPQSFKTAIGGSRNIYQNSIVNKNVGNSITTITSNSGNNSSIQFFR